MTGIQEQTLLFFLRHLLWDKESCALQPSLLDYKESLRCSTVALTLVLLRCHKVSFS